MNYTVYRKDTGQILNILFCNNISQQEIPDSNNYIIGAYDPNIYYIENETPVFIPSKPEGKYYVFNFELKQWVLDSNLAIQDVLPKRSNLLYSSDWTQLPNGPLTAAQQAAWANYRQRLRDVTDQSGYPFNVLWPIAP